MDMDQTEMGWKGGMLQEVTRRIKLIETNDSFHRICGSILGAGRIRGRRVSLWVYNYFMVTERTRGESGWQSFLLFSVPIYFAVNYNNKWRGTLYPIQRPEREKWDIANSDGYQLSSNF